MLKKLAATGVLAFAGAGVLLTSSPAFADDGPGTYTTNGTGSVLGGNQLYLGVGAPINICGDSIGLVGVAGSGCHGGALSHNG